MRQIRKYRLCIAALWLLSQTVALSAAPARLVSSGVESWLASSDSEDHACCKGGRICPMHRHHRRSATPEKSHTDAGLHAGHKKASDSASPSEGCAMRTACNKQPAAIVMALMIPGVLPDVSTPADAASQFGEIAVIPTHALTRVTPPDLPPPR